MTFRHLAAGLAAALTTAVLAPSATALPTTASSGPPASAARAAAPSVTSAIAGETAAFSGVVPSPSGKRAVRLEKRTGGTWRPIASARTSATGRYVLQTAQPGFATSFRVVAPRRGNAPRVVTKARTATPARQLVRITNPPTVDLGSTFTVEVQALPARPGRPVTLVLASAPRTVLGTGRVGADGRARISITAAAGGALALRVTAERWRGAVPAYGTGSVAVTADPSHHLVSVRLDGRPGNEYSGEVDSSADGRYVVFSSYAANLVPGITSNSTRHVYLRDTVAQTTTLLSKSAQGAPGNEYSETPRISASGRYVVFRTFADNLGFQDVNGDGDIYRYDRQTDALTLVSHVPGDPTTALSGDSVYPAISPNGYYVTFSTRAREVSHDATSAYQVVRYATDVQVTRLITYAAGETYGADGSSWQSEVDGAGNVVLLSDADDLGPVDTHSAPDLYFYDSVADAFTNITAAAGASSETTFDFSTSSTSVVFSTPTALLAADSDAMPDVYRWFVPGRSLQLLTSGPGAYTHPTTSDTGQFVLYTATVDRRSTATVLDLGTGNAKPVATTRDGGPTISDSQAGAISGNGAWAYYLSSADDVIGEAADGNRQVVGSATGLVP